MESQQNRKLTRSNTVAGKMKTLGAALQQSQVFTALPRLSSYAISGELAATNSESQRDITLEQQHELKLYEDFLTSWVATALKQKLDLFTKSTQALFKQGYKYNMTRAEKESVSSERELLVKSLGTSNNAKYKAKMRESLISYIKSMIVLDEQVFELDRYKDAI